MSAPRYTRAELGVMARVALQHRAVASQQWLLLLLHLAVRCRLEQHHCVANIEYMAGWHA